MYNLLLLRMEKIVSGELLAERVMSAPGVSVGTTLALETILPNWPVFDPNREKPPAVNLFEYKRVWINLGTLFRNLYSALHRERLSELKSSDAGEALYHEMETIAGAIKEGTQGAVVVHFYWCDYKDLAKLYPKASLRVPATEKQLKYRDHMEKAVKLAIRTADLNMPGLVTTYNTQIKPLTYGKTLLITHYPVDLLSEARFGSISLLESHTGVIKNKTLWHTKFFNGKSLSNIPFNALTLQVFGDDVHFKPLDAKIRNAILEIAEKGHWNWMTTASKMRSNIGGYNDPFFVMQLNALL